MGLKEEEKGMKPLFPRLHVNDSEKEEPRAPLRNQITISEKFSVPTQSRLSGSSSVWSLPSSSRTRGSFIPSASINQVHSYERNLRSASPSGKHLDTSIGTRNRTKEVSEFHCLNTDRSTHPRVEQYSYSNRMFKWPGESPPPGSTLMLQFRTQSLSQNSLQGTHSNPLTGRNRLVDASSSSSGKIMRSESTKRQNRALDLECTGDSQEKECTGTEYDNNLEDEHSLECSRPSSSEIKSTSFPWKSRKCVGQCQPKPGSCGNECVVDYNPRYYVRKSSVANPLSTATACLSPASVMALIGETHFWKIRRSLLKQQRLFSAQVFELHRLIKVQKLIPRSQHLHKRNSSYIGRPNTGSSWNMPPIILKSSRKPEVMKAKAEGKNGNAMEKLPLPSINSSTSKDLFDIEPGQEPLKKVPTNTRPSPWCFPGSGNQWLVPVMSPSEGLIYKLCSGPDPLTTASLSGVPSPISLHTGETTQLAFGFPAPPRQGRIATYDIPSVSSLPAPCPAIDQFNPSSAAHHGSCNVSTQRGFRKLPVSKGSKPQGSTGCSPEKKELPLFPTKPHSQPLHKYKHVEDQGSVRAIKAVPHNPRLASESAARIFRFIQEERRQESPD